MFRKKFVFLITSLAITLLTCFQVTKGTKIATKMDALIGVKEEVKLV